MIIITNFRILWAWARCFYFVLFDKDELDVFILWGWVGCLYFMWMGGCFYVMRISWMFFYLKRMGWMFLFDVLCVLTQESSDDRDRVAEPRQALFFKIFKLKIDQLITKLISDIYVTEKKIISILFPDILQDWVPVVYLLQVSSWRIRIRPNNADHSGFVTLISQCSTGTYCLQAVLRSRSVYFTRSGSWKK